MLNSIRETRAVKEGLHNITLEIPEKIYNTFYDKINEDNAMNILEQYLNYHQDDGVPRNVKIKHIKGTHTVNIYADLHYLNNKKSTPKHYADDAVDGI